MGTRSFWLLLVLFLPVFTFLFISIHFVERDVALKPATKNVAASYGGGDLGLMDNKKEREARKVAGEDNMGGGLKVLLTLEKLRAIALLGFQNSNSGRSVAFSSAPVPIEEALAPVPAHAGHSHRAHRAHLCHHSPLPRLTQMPPLHVGQSLRSDSSRPRVVVAGVVFIAVITLVIGIAFVLLYRRSRRNQKRMEGILLVTNPICKAGGGQSSSRCGSGGVSFSSSLILQNGSSTSIRENGDDHDECFHSICNSEDLTSPCSNTSGGRPLLSSEDHSSDLTKLSFPSPDRFLTPITTLELKPSHSPSSSGGGIFEVRTAASSPNGSPRSENSKETTASSPMCSSNKCMTSLLPKASDGNLCAPNKSLPLQTFGTKCVTKPPPPPPPSPPLISPSPSKQESCNRKDQRRPASTIPPRSRLGFAPTPPLPPARPSSFATESNSHEPHTLVSACKDESSLPKLKPLHWDKVSAAADRSMVWDKITRSSFELNEERIESLFSYGMQANEALGKASPSPGKHVLEPTRLQNLTILLKALHASTEQVCNSLMEGTDALSAQQLEVLMKMAPTMEEAANLSHFDNGHELGPAERFVKAILSVPYSFQRIEVMLYKETFGDEVALIDDSLRTLQEACEELRSSRLFKRLLEAVLKVGNRMNVGTARGEARAFKLDALLRLPDVKGTDGKTTLLHFVAQEVIRSVGFDGTPVKTTGDAKSNEEREEDHRSRAPELVYRQLGTELCNVKKSAGMDLEVLAASLSNLCVGMEKLRRLVEDDLAEEDGSAGFVHLMSCFGNRSQQVIEELKEKQNQALVSVREIAKYFHGDIDRNKETDPLRIFAVVNDFLGMLERVCK